MIRVPLAALPDATWMDLRRLAFRCAAFGNHLLSESYIKAKGGPVMPTYTDARGELSAAIRDAVSRECVGVWRRLGRKILRGEQTLARFSGDRALVVRDRGVRVARDETGALVIALRLLPREQGAVTTLPVWMPALRKDRRLAELLDAFVAGDRDISKATVIFRRPGRKVFVLLTYPADAAKPAIGGPQATLGPLDHDEHGAQLWLRANGRALSLTNRLFQLRAMKAHYAGVHARLRHGLGKRGRRHDHRRALLAAGSYTEAALGPLHEWSREIIAWCQREGVGSLVWALASDDGDLPWSRLMQMVRYKALEAGIVVSQIVHAAEQDEASRSDGATDASARKSRGRKRGGE